MADPLRWQILEALRDRFAAIVGDGGANYHYSVDAAHIEEAWTDAVLMTSLAEHPVIVVIVPAEGEKTSFHTFTMTRGEMRVDVVALKHWPDQGTPYGGRPDPTRVEIKEQLAKDIERNIKAANAGNGGDNLGGRAIYCDVTDIETSAEETYDETWAVVILRAVITYTHPDLTP